MGRSEAGRKKEELLRKTSEELIDDLKGRWPNYDKWIHFPWGCWKPENKMHWPRFDGRGEAKAPFLNYSGRHNVPPPQAGAPGQINQQHLLQKPVFDVEDPSR